MIIIIHCKIGHTEKMLLCILQDMFAVLYFKLLKSDETAAIINFEAKQKHS